MFDLHGRAAGAAIVGPGDRDAHARGLDVGFGRLPLCEAHRVAERAEPAQRPGEVEQPGGAAGRGVHGQQLRGPVPERAAGQAGEHRPRPDFQERADPVGLHGVELAHEIHRPQQVLAQHPSGLAGSVRVGRTGGVRVDGDRARGDADFLQRLDETLPGALHERAVEGSADRQRRHGEPAAAAAFGGFRHRLARPGQDPLLRTVAVGKHHRQRLFREQALYLRQGGAHGQHGAGRGRGHGGAAGGGELVEVRFLDPAGRTERGQFAEAVARGRVGDDPEAGEGLQHGQADGAERRLGRVGRPQLRLGVDRGGAGAGVEVVAERRGALPVRLGLFQRRERLGEHAGQLTPHADVLAALAGEQEREPAAFDPGAEPGVRQVEGRRFHRAPARRRAPPPGRAAPRSGRWTPAAAGRGARRRSARASVRRPPARRASP